MMEGRTPQQQGNAGFAKSGQQAPSYPADHSAGPLPLEDLPLDPFRNLLTSLVRAYDRIDAEVARPDG